MTTPGEEPSRFRRLAGKPPISPKTVMQALATIFGQTNAVTPLQECTRAVLISIYGWGLIRLLGRRVFGRWSSLDIVVALVIGSNLSRALTGNASLWGTLAATTVLFIIHHVVAVACACQPSISHFAEGRAITLMRSGEWRESVRKLQGISEADINESLRQNGLTEAERVEAIMLEPSGKMTVLKKS